VGASQNNGLRMGWMIVESSPSFWECPLPMGFTHCKAQGRGYYDPKLGIERDGFLYLLKSGRDLIPTNRHNFPPLF